MSCAPHESIDWMRIGSAVPSGQKFRRVSVKRNCFLIKGEGEEARGREGSEESKLLSSKLTSSQRRGRLKDKRCRNEHQWPS